VRTREGKKGNTKPKRREKRGGGGGSLEGGEKSFKELTPRTEGGGGGRQKGWEKVRRSSGGDWTQRLLGENAGGKKGQLGE